MLKLLFIPTGNIFVLPDVEVFKIKEQDRKGEYKILDAGYQEKKIEKISVEEAKSIAEQEVEELSTEVPDESVQQPTPPSLKHVNEKEYLEMKIDLENSSKTELVGYAKRLGLKVYPTRDSKSTIIKRIKETGIVK